jgi:hypothetical protein
MESDDSTTVHQEQEPPPIRQPTPHHGPGHVPRHVPGQRHPARPIDLSYRLVGRTVLWLIAGMVFLGFALWWILT